MAISTASAPSTVQAAPRDEHVVFVLTPKERDLFLPGWQGSVRLDARHSWLDPGGLDERAWTEALRGLQPTALVIAWSCPAFPREWALREECPLRYVCGITGSIKTRVPRRLLERGVLASNWGNLISHTVAEHALLMALACLRNLPKWDELMTRPRDVFEVVSFLKNRSLRGKRVGLHGFGAIARELAGMLRPHQVVLSAYSQGVPRAFYGEFGARPCGSLAELFAGSDVLVECEGLNGQSEGSVTEELLRLLPPDAVFINVGRGRVVADEEALARLAREGRLRVALDVYHHEPLPLDSPLLGNPNVLLSPHVAGATWDTWPLCGRQALNNLEKYLRGEAPDHLITPETYDRAT